MTPAVAARLAWSLLALYGVVQGLTLWLIWQGPANFGDVVGVVTAGYAVVGALVAARVPRSAVGWLLVAVALAFSVNSFGAVYAATRSNPGYVAAAWLGQLSAVVALLLTAMFLPLVFPDGRLVSARWRPVAWLGAVAFTVCLLGSAFAPGRMDLDGDIPSVTNPVGAHGTLGGLVDGAANVGAALAVLTVLLAVASLAVRLHRSRGTERQQLKWFVLAALFAMAGLALAMVGAVRSDGWFDVLSALGYFTFAFASILGVPAAIGIAILRHRLYDIDVVINRTLVYVTLTVILVAAYVGTVLLFRLAVDPWTGSSDLAVAVSTLAVAALFRPARARIQAVVDRRFYRARYDAARTLEAFSGQLRNELDLEALTADLRAVVRQTMQPTSTSLWIRDAR
jgi:hypothetical protein